MMEAVTTAGRDRAIRKRLFREKIEETLTRLLGETVEIDGAGRTDAGVHALGQSANFHTDRKLDPEKLKAELNTYLPEDRRGPVEEVPERFHSRLNALGNLPCRWPPARGKMFLRGSRSIRSISLWMWRPCAWEQPFWWEKKIFAAFLL